MKKRVIIMRGLPGSGKSTRAREIVAGAPDGEICSTDDWFVGKDGVYRYDTTMAGVAHSWNFNRFRLALVAGFTPIVVDNTNVRRDHYLPYVHAAENAGYEVEIEKVDTDLSDEALAARTTHGVPVEVIRHMREGFE